MSSEDLAQLIATLHKTGPVGLTPFELRHAKARLALTVWEQDGRTWLRADEKPGA